MRPLGFALSDEYVRRAGLDYWQYLDLAVYDNWDDFLARANPGRMYFLSTKDGHSLYDTAFAPGDTLVFGSESSGLPDSFYERYRDSLVRIPDRLVDELARCPRKRRTSSRSPSPSTSRRCTRGRISVC